MDRRQFTASLMGAPFLLGFRGHAHAGGRGGPSVVPAGEPGTPLLVSGTIYGPDGRTPLSSMRLFLYQTDADGYYNRDENDPRKARLRTTVTTDAGGRYAFRTIKPGHYPGRKQDAHIHVHLSGPGIETHWIDNFLFQGDPNLRDGDRTAPARLGPFSHVMVTDGESVLRARRDIRLDLDVARRNRLTDGWYRT